LTFKPGFYQTEQKAHNPVQIDDGAKYPASLDSNFHDQQSEAFEKINHKAAHRIIMF